MRLYDVMKKNGTKRILVACCLGVLLAGMSNGCISRKITEDGKYVDEKIIWFWQDGFRSP